MKEPIEWKKFTGRIPDCKYVWVSDYKTVWLSESGEINFSINADYTWATATPPEVPKKERHRCENREGDPIPCCYESAENILYLETYSQMGRLMPWPVQFCPFCGYKPEGK